MNQSVPQYPFDKSNDQCWIHGQPVSVCVIGNDGQCVDHSEEHVRVIELDFQDVRLKCGK